MVFECLNHRADDLAAAALVGAEEHPAKRTGAEHPFGRRGAVALEHERRLD